MPSVVVAPGESIQDAITAAGAGGTVTVQPGTYTYFTLPASVTGAEGAPTTVQSAVKWGARIVAPSGQHGILVSDGCDWAVIDGFQVSDGPQDGIKTNADHTTVQNCWVHDNSGQGINAIGAASFICDSNLIEDNGTDTALEHGIYCDTSGSVIRNNIVRGNATFGIHQYVAAGTQNASIYQNICYGNGSSGILIRGVGAGTACGHVINNNIIGMVATDAEAPIRIDACNGAVVANNIIFPGTGVLVDERDATTGTVWTNNIVYPLIDNQNTHGAVNTNELLTNGDFELVTGNNFNNWSESAGGSSTVTDGGAGNADTGSHCAALTIDGSNNYAQIQYGSITTAGRVYVLEFRAKADAACTMALSSPSLSFELGTAYRTYRAVFTAATTAMTLGRGSAAGRVIYIDNVSLKRAYGPSLHGAPQGLFFPRLGSSAIDAGSNTYKPAADFWGETPPATVQIGAFPYTEHLHPRTMLHNPWDITKVNRRWWNWRRREQTLKPA